MEQKTASEISPDGAVGNDLKEKVYYTNKFYVGFLIAILSLLLLNNILVLFQSGALLSLLPIVFQSVVLIFLFTKHKWTIIAVRTWALIILIGGLAKFVGTSLRLVDFYFFESVTSLEEISIGSTIFMLLSIIVGSTYFFFAKRHIKTERNTLNV